MMKRTKVKIHIQGSGISSDGLGLQLSEAVVKHWKIPLSETVQLCYGSSRQDVKVVPLSRPGTLRLSSMLAAKWGLAKDDQLCIQYKSGTQTLLLGPLIGVMVSR